MPQKHILPLICFAWDPINFSYFITFGEFRTGKCTLTLTNIYKLFISYNYAWSQRVLKRKKLIKQKGVECHCLVLLQRGIKDGWNTPCRSTLKSRPHANSCEHERRQRAEGRVLADSNNHFFDVACHIGKEIRKESETTLSLIRSSSSPQHIGSRKGMWLSHNQLPNLHLGMHSLRKTNCKIINWFKRNTWATIESKAVIVHFKLMVILTHNGELKIGWQQCPSKTWFCCFTTKIKCNTRNTTDVFKKCVFLYPHIICFFKQ